MEKEPAKAVRLRCAIYTRKSTEEADPALLRDTLAAVAALAALLDRLDGYCQIDSG